MQALVVQPLRVPVRRSRVIVVAVPTGCLQPVGTALGLYGAGASVLLRSSEKADI